MVLSGKVEEEIKFFCSFLSKADVAKNHCLLCYVVCDHDQIVEKLKLGG